MTLTPEQIAELDARAKLVGEHIGWELGFVVARNAEYIGLIAGPDRVVVGGLNKLSDLAAHEVDFLLDDLDAGRRHLVPDEDGDPRLV